MLFTDLFTSGPWMQIKVKAMVDGARIDRLDDHLTGATSAFVESTKLNGRYIYEPAPDGTYTVRVMDAGTVGIIKGIIDHNCFVVVSEVTHE